MLNRLELLGTGSLSELASAHGIEPGFSTKHDARDVVVRHIVTGACDSGNGGLCASVRSTYIVRSDQHKPINLQSHILDGTMKTANRKIFLRTLCVLDVPHSPTDPIVVFSILDHDTAFATVAKFWSQRVPHPEKRT